MAGIYDIVIVGSLLATGYFVLTSGVLENIQVGGQNVGGGGIVEGDTGGLTTGDGGLLPVDETGGNKVDVNIGGSTNTTDLQSKCSSTCKSKYPGMVMSPKWKDGSCYCNINYSSTCSKVCAAKYPGENRKPRISSDGRTCFCDKPATTTTTTTKPKTGCGCPASTCNQFSGNTCLSCCCSKRCAQLKKSNQTMSPKLDSKGTCLCNFKTVTSTATSVSKLTAGCTYTGCNGFTGMTRCQCRCTKICASKGGVKSVGSDGSCHCKSSAAFANKVEAIQTYKYSNNNNIPYAYMIKQERSAADMAIAN